MLTFFRRIRKGLLASGATRKYIIYAIGEIALVVIGILIALSINNWNENRKDRQKEQAILNQLRLEFDSNLKQLDGKINSKEMSLVSAKKLFSYIDFPSLRNKDSIEYYLGRTLPYTTFDPIVNDLASSGNLRLIKNENLKQLLSFWTSEIKNVEEDDFSWQYYRDEYYVPFLVEHYQLRTIRNEAMKTNVLGKYLIEEENIEELGEADQIGITKHKVDYNRLLDHPDFEDHIERCYTTNKFAYSQSMILRKRIVEILDILNQEIK